MDSEAAELGLEGQNGSEDLEAFDAFNDDTFGAGADAWNEDDHEELAKLTEEEIHGFNAGNEFFELDKDSSALDDCLEPPDVSTINGDQELSQKMTSLSMIPPPPKPTISPDFVDPAIMSMGSMPLPPSRPPPPMFPAPNAGPMTVEELERQMMAQQQQDIHQQQMRHQEEQQRMRQMQQQQFMMQQQQQQQMMMRAQMQHQQYLRQQQQMVEQQRQQMMQNQRQQQQQGHGGGFQSRQQQLHQQFHQGRRQDYDNYNKG